MGIRRSWMALGIATGIGTGIGIGIGIRVISVHMPTNASASRFLWRVGAGAAPARPQRVR